jgi:hypothetical protein
MLSDSDKRARRLLIAAWAEQRRRLLLWYFIVAISQALDCAPEHPVPDAGAADQAAQPAPDLQPALPACLPCSLRLPAQGCVPSLCARRETGQLCCAGVS